MTRRVPRSPRETLETFLLYEDSLGLESIVRRMEWTGVTPRQLYYAALGRLPESAAAARATPEYNARVQFIVAVSCAEFQENIISLFLGAFPERRREFFIHIPKCAGTDFVETMEKKLPRLNEHLPRTAETSTAQLFQELRRLVARTHSSDAIAVTGHTPLVWYEQRNLVRFGDQVYTIIRNPLEIYFSHINFILTRLSEFRRQRRTDTDEWLSCLGLNEMPEAPSKSFLTEQARKIIRNPAITTPNTICYYLSDGTAEAAIERAVIHDIEITDVSRYSGWRKRCWNWDWQIRHNESRPLVLREDLTAADWNHINDISAEDRKLYQMVMQALKSADSDCIRGSTLADFK